MTCLVAFWTSPESIAPAIEDVQGWQHRNNRISQTARFVHSAQLNRLLDVYGICGVVWENDHFAEPVLTEVVIRPQSEVDPIDSSRQ